MAVASRHRNRVSLGRIGDLGTHKLLQPARSPSIEVRAPSLLIPAQGIDDRHRNGRQPLRDQIFGHGENALLPVRDGEKERTQDNRLGSETHLVEERYLTATFDPGKSKHEPVDPVEREAAKRKAFGGCKPEFLFRPQNLPELEADQNSFQPDCFSTTSLLEEPRPVLGTKPHQDNSVSFM